MFIHKGKNCSYTDKKNSGFEKKIHILSEKIINDISSYKKNSFRNDKYKNHYIEIRNYGNKDNNYKNKTIIPNNQKHQSKIKFKISKNKEFNNSIRKANNIPFILNHQSSTVNLNDNNNYYNKLLINVDANKENISIPQTSRYDFKKKEKYLKNIFNNFIDSKDDNDININKLKNIKYEKNKINLIPFDFETINALSRRNNSAYKMWNNNINKYKNFHNNNNIDSENESTIKLKEELDYEYEIRKLQKKLKEMKKKNYKLKFKLNEIKNEQKLKRTEKNGKEFIISKVIEICRNISFSEKNNFFSSFSEIYNDTLTYLNSKENMIDNLKSFPATKLFKNMLLNLMDLKFEYENILLKDQFIFGIKNLLCKDNRNEFKDNEEFIYDNLKALIKKEMKLKKICNKYKNFSLENKKYYDYFLRLCNNLNINSFPKLDNFLKNSIIKINEEFEQINQIKKIVMENNNSKSTIDINTIIQNNNENDINNNYKILYQQYFLNEKPLMKRNCSELKINNNIKSIVKENDNNPNRYHTNRSLMNKNIAFRNNDDFSHKKMTFTGRHNNSLGKNRNSTVNKEKINLYDFNKENNFQHYSNDNNKVPLIEETSKNNLNRKTIDTPHNIKNMKIHHLKKAKKLNKNYNNIINFKKKELGLNCRIKNTIKTYLKDSKNKKKSKSQNKELFYEPKN